MGQKVPQEENRQLRPRGCVDGKRLRSVKSIFLIVSKTPFSSQYNLINFLWFNRPVLQVEIRKWNWGFFCSNSSSLKMRSQENKTLNLGCRSNIFFAYKFTSARENQQPQIDHIAGGKHTIEWGGPFKGEDINILLTVHPLGVS